MSESTESSISAFLTVQEREDVAKMRSEDDVLGYAVFSPSGDELESKGIGDDVVPVFANIFDSADRLGDEIGEDDGEVTVSLETGDLTYVGISLSSSKAVFLKQNETKAGG